MEIALRFERLSTQNLFPGLPLVSNVIELHPFERPADDDHDIHSWKEELTRRTESFSNEPFRTISDDRVADLA
jgi:hypothetical protein